MYHQLAPSTVIMMHMPLRRMIRMMLLMMNRKKQWELLGALGRRRELILSVLKAAIHPHAPSSYSNTALKYNTDTDTSTKTNPNIKTHVNQNTDTRVSAKGSISSTPTPCLV